MSFAERLERWITIAAFAFVVGGVSYFIGVKRGRMLEKLTYVEKSEECLKSFTEEELIYTLNAEAQDFPTFFTTFVDGKVKQCIEKEDEEKTTE